MSYGTVESGVELMAERDSWLLLWAQRAQL